MNCRTLPRLCCAGIVRAALRACSSFTWFVSYLLTIAIAQFVLVLHKKQNSSCLPKNIQLFHEIVRHTARAPLCVNSAKGAKKSEKAMEKRDECQRITWKWWKINMIGNVLIFNAMSAYTKSFTLKIVLRGALLVSNWISREQSKGKEKWKVIVEFVEWMWRTGASVSARTLQLHTTSIELDTSSTSKWLCSKYFRTNNKL